VTKREKWGYVKETNRLLRKAVRDIKKQPEAVLTFAEVCRRTGLSRDIVSDKRSPYTEVKKEIREAVQARVQAVKAKRTVAAEERRAAVDEDERKHDLACEVIRRWNLSRGRTADGEELGTKTNAERRRSLQVVSKPTLKGL